MQTKKKSNTTANTTKRKILKRDINYIFYGLVFECLRVLTMRSVQSTVNFTPVLFVYIPCKVFGVLKKGMFVLII